MSSTKNVTVPKPYLKQIEAQDLTALPKGEKPTEYERSVTTGFAKSESREAGREDTHEIHAEVSGTYGFSEISSVTATVGGSSGTTSHQTTTTSSDLNTSTTETRKFSFPSGFWRGYFQWAVDLAGHTLYLDEAIVGLTSAEEKAAMEDKALPVLTIKGTPKGADPSGLTPDVKEYYLRMIRDGKANIMHTSEYTWNNEVVYGYFNDWEKRDEEARKFGTYSNGRFSLDYHGRGRWYCCLAAKAVLAQGNKLDAK